KLPQVSTTRSAAQAVLCRRSKPSVRRVSLPVFLAASHLRARRRRIPGGLLVLRSRVRPPRRTHLSVHLLHIGRRTLTVSDIDAFAFTPKGSSTADLHTTNLAAEASLHILGMCAFLMKAHFFLRLGCGSRWLPDLDLPAVGLTLS